MPQQSKSVVSYHEESSTGFCLVAQAVAGGYQARVYEDGVLAPLAKSEVVHSGEIGHTLALIEAEDMAMAEAALSD